MTGSEERSINRDSLFLLATVQVEAIAETHRVRVRNLSDGGMMAEGDARVQRGSRLKVELRNVGTISGSVAWVQDNRFGIAFDSDIDSQRARSPVKAAGNETHEGIVSRAHRAPPPPAAKAMRTI